VTENKPARIHHYQIIDLVSHTIATNEMSTSVNFWSIKVTSAHTPVCFRKKLRRKKQKKRKHQRKINAKNARCFKIKGLSKVTYYRKCKKVARLRYSNEVAVRRCGFPAYLATNSMFTFFVFFVILRLKIILLECILQLFASSADCFDTDKNTGSSRGSNSIHPSSACWNAFV